MKEKQGFKKGDWLKCIKGSEFFTKDKYYMAIGEGIFHDDRNIPHGISDEFAVGLFQKLYTIQDLKDGIVAVVNDGTVEELTRVLNCRTQGIDKFYFAAYKGIINLNWNSACATTLPTQSVKDFLAQLPKKKEEAWTPKVGEKVQFKFHSETSLWLEAEYLASDKGSKYSYAVVVTDSNGNRVIESVAEIRQIPKKVKVTKQRVADILGIELNQLEIID